MTSTTDTLSPAKQRSTLRAVAVPSEHGGWGLTLEPGILGLAVAWGAPGACLAAAALVAFVARTPLKIVLVDRHRGRSLERTRVATRVVVAELTILAALIIAAFALGRATFWVPAVVAGPLILLELWFEMRSRGRRLAPELAGAVGVCSVAAMIVLADGGSARLAVGVWLVMTARAVTSIPHVRALIDRMHGRPYRATDGVVADCVSILCAIAAAWLDRGLVAGACAMATLVVIQRISNRGPVRRATALGIRQMVMGFGVVVVTAVGVLASGVRT